jgi:geranylgeranyl diphosphate synthase, type I
MSNAVNPLRQTKTSPIPMDHVEAFMAEKALTATSGNLAAAIRYQLASGGGRFRARLALSACEALALASTTAISLAAGCELIHNASLIHDDLQDGDTTRRGAPALWQQYGQNLAICAGDLMLSAGISTLVTLMANMRSQETSQIIHCRIAELIDGQCQDLAHTESTSLDLDGYCDIAVKKSGTLIALPLELALLIANRNGAAELARRSCERYALGYQIADDILDAETDRENDRLNIVNILAKSDSDPASTATTLALTALNDAANISLSLPRDCGRLINSQATTLSNSLLCQAGVNQ